MGINVDGFDPTMPWIASITTSSAYNNANVGIFSTSRADAGTYKLEVDMWIIDGTFEAHIDTIITLVLIDPCLTTSFNPNSLSSMTTSVLVSPVLASQNIVACTYVTNIDCGAINYSLDNQFNFLTLDTNMLTLSLVSTSSGDVGTYNINLVATLVSYPTITHSIPFSVRITPCVPMSLSPALDNVLVSGGTLPYVVGSEVISVTVGFD